MLVCLVSKSACGKDTVARELINRGYNKIVSHTTRPMRSGEIDGRDYWFTNEKPDSNAACLRTYDVASGDTWYYWIDKSDIIKAVESPNISVCIADAIGANELKSYGCEIIYIYSDWHERLQRYYKRESKNVQPNYDEMVRRLVADERDFKHFEKIALSGEYDCVYNNGGVDELIDNVINVIKSL